jgi:hypothetical protein
MMSASNNAMCSVPDCAGTPIAATLTMQAYSLLLLSHLTATQIPCREN